MLKKAIFFVIFLVLLFSLFSFPRAVAQEKSDIVVFVRDGCTHCADEKTFLKQLQQKRSDIQIKYYQLEDKSDYRLWEVITARLELSKVTPLTIVGRYVITGFSTKETTGEEIIQAIETQQKKGIITNLDTITKQNIQTNVTPAAVCLENGSVPCTLEKETSINIPFFGKIDTQKYPLGILAAILGFVDGFNPCAMWVLVTFLLILLQVGNRRKMFLIAGTFIFAETLMYYLILNVWFTTWDFVKLDAIVTPVVGLLAVGSGLYFLYEWRKKEIECRVTDAKKRFSTKKAIEKIALGKFTFVTFIGILALAFSVNIIEFACSIGIPQTFTKIIEVNNLSFWQSQSMMLIYILFYMIDDFIVFGIALYGIDKLAVTKKYSRLTNLIGGVLMIILGCILLFRPSLLLF